MSDINVRSDSVDVEQIMRQIRARIREKRGADYTETELQQLATVKLQQFMDPRGVRSDLVQQFRRHRPPSAPLPNFAFEDTTLFETHRGPLRSLRRLLRPILKLFFNPNTLSDALHIQAQVNQLVQERLAERERLDPLLYEVIHNLVVETTRLGIEVQNLKMRVESLGSRLDFDERRARALEDVVEYRPARRRDEGAPEGAAGGAGAEAGPAGEGGERRRRRRRRRRRPGQTGADRAAQPQAGDGAPEPTGHEPDDAGDEDRDTGRSAPGGPDEAEPPDDSGASDQ